MNTRTFAMLLGLILVVLMVSIVGLPRNSNSGFADSDTVMDKPASDLYSNGTTESSNKEITPLSSKSGTQSESQYSPPSLNEAVVPPETIRVSGQVSDENNRPIENAMVSDESNFSHVRTDATGAYQIEIRLPRYKSPFLNFLRTGYQENRVGVPMDQISEEATILLDVQLHEADNSTTVHGWVGNDLGQGLAGHAVELRARSFPNSGTLFYAVISDEQGDFTFEGIRSGQEYRLDIQPTSEYAGYSLEPYLVSKNTRRTVIVLDTLELVDISGMIVGVDNAPIADFSINIQNLSVDTPDRRITGDSSGFFKLDAFPAGEVKLSTNAPEYFKITGVTIRENEYQHLTLMIDRGAYHLSGWVSDVNGVPLSEARVTLNANFKANEYHSYSYRSKLSDANGGFEFERIGGGVHSLSVFAAGYRTRVVKHTFTNYSDSVNIRLERDDN